MSAARRKNTQNDARGRAQMRDPHFESLEKDNPEAPEARGHDSLFIMKRVITHQYDVDFAHAHSRALDNDFAARMVGREAPNDLVCPNQDIVRIGNLCDMAHVRRVDISFNPLTDLMGLDQLPQLRDLSAYGCKLMDLDFVNGTPRVERLIVHQNKITDLPACLGKCTKLRELRADKNRIAAVGKFLQGCGALRVLDLSWNNIATIDGIAGLQNLQELRLSNNSIKSLKPLKGLPSLTELDVVANQLRSLDGIQQVPTLESIHAEHNMLTTARVPYSTTHMGRVPITKKAVMGSGEDGVMVAARTSSSAAAGGSSGNEQHGMPHLSEMYLAGNRITSLASMDSLGHCAEVIDLSNNALADALAVVAALKQMHKLSELRLAGNPCVLEGMLHSVAESLAHDCGVLQMVDDLVIVGGRVVGVGSPQKAPVQAFHTWEREVDDGEGESAPSTQRSTAAPPAADDEDADSEDDEEFLKDETVGTFRQRGESIPDANVHQDEGRNAPRINLEHVLSQGQVQAMEGEFKGLIEGTIARMDVAAQEYGQDPDDAAMFERAQRSELEEQAHQLETQLERGLEEQAVAVAAERVEEELRAAEREELRAKIAIETASADLKQKETEYAAERIRQILRSKVPLRPEKQMAALAALPGGSRKKKQLLRKGGGPKAGSVGSRNEAEVAASRQDARAREVADEVARLKEEFGPNVRPHTHGATPPSSSEGTGGIPSPTRSVTSLGSVRSIGSSRSAGPSNDKYKNGLLGDGGPSKHSSGLSKYGSRVKKTHFGTNAPSYGGSNKPAADDRDPFDFEEIDRLSNELSGTGSSSSAAAAAKGSSTVGVGPLSGSLGRFDDPDAVALARGLLEPASAKSLISMGVTGSPTNLADHHHQQLSPSQQSPSPPRNGRRGVVSPKAMLLDMTGSNFEGAMPAIPSSPINTARGAGDGTISPGSGGPSSPFDPETEAEARLLALRQGRGKGFNAFSGIMSQVADPRFANRTRALGLSELDAGVRSQPVSRAATPRGGGGGEDSCTLGRSESMPMASPGGSNNSKLSINLDVLPPGKENSATAHTNADRESYGLIPASGSDSQLVSPGYRQQFASDMNDDDVDLGMSDANHARALLSARRVTSAKARRPLSAGAARFKIPDDARALLASRKDSDAPILDSLTSLSVATLETLDVTDVYGYEQE